LAPPFSRLHLDLRCPFAMGSLASSVMGTDVKLKVLFRTYAKDLVRLTGDEGARVLAVDTVELQELRRQVDCVIKLRRGGETYYRHLEFPGAGRPADGGALLPHYNSQLVLRLGAPVLTTVVYLTSRAPREGELVFRVMLEGREINIWRFEVLRLWEVEAKKAVLGGEPGVLALVPLMAGGQVRHRHPEVADRAAVRVNTCEDASLLRRWALAASDPASDLVRVMGLEAPPRRGRAGSVGRNGRRK